MLFGRPPRLREPRKTRAYIGDESANNASTELRLYTDCYIRFRFPEAPEALYKEC